MVGNYIDVLVVSIGTAAPTWQGRTAACSGLAYEHHGDLACHGACSFNMAEDWREQSPCLCSGSMRGGKRGGARRSVCRHIGVRVEPSAGRRGRGSDGRPLDVPLQRTAVLDEVERVEKRLLGGAAVAAAVVHQPLQRRAADSV